MSPSLSPSPITPELIAKQTAVNDLGWDAGGALIWLEKRPEGGLLRVQEEPANPPRPLNPQRPARGRVGYGGGDFSAAAGHVFFVEAASGRLFRQPLAAGPDRPLTPAFGGAAAPALSPDGRWLVYVHTAEGVDCLAVVDADGRQWPQRLVAGEDFYMDPSWHPAGDRLAWVAWNQPHMPWDSATLYLAELRFLEGATPVIASCRAIVGGPGVSVMQPRFSPDGRTLAYLSDESGAWQIHMLDLETRQHRRLTDLDGEIGGPAWVQGQRDYAFDLSGTCIYALRQKGGFRDLWQIPLDSGRAVSLPLPEDITWLEQIAVSPVDGEVAVIASGWRSPPAVLNYHPEAGFRTRASASSTDLPPEVFSRPQPVSWKAEDGQLVHGLYYPPLSRPGSAGPPPLVVHIHSGPTSLAKADYDLGLQYFAGRGFAVLAVNYRGSSGYGRAFRDALRGAWGNLDVEDVVSGAHYLVRQGLANGGRMALHSSSAGAMTALLALVRHPGLFRAAICRYPVVDHTDFGARTHKFEAHYNRFLLGPLPEAADVYRARSPLYQAEKIRDPVAIFHGEEDPVVPRADSDAFVAALQAAGTPVEYMIFPGEGHGFRAPETINAYYEAVQRFLAKYAI